MSRRDLTDVCTVARSLEVVGDRWTVLVLRDAFYGVRRFDDFQRNLGIARNILTDRLHKLVAQGVLERQQYQDRPARYEYRLTEKGRDLLPVVLAMMRWGDRWTAAASGPPVTLTHTGCGATTQPHVVCSECGDELRLDSVRVRGAAPAAVTVR